MQKISRYIILLCLSLLLASCFSNNPTTIDVQYRNPKLPDSRNILALLNKQQLEWKRTPYRLGGLSKSGIDCSGFIMKTYQDLFNIKLPRVTKEQAKIGKKVSLRNMAPGDLMFFKTGRGPYGLHVGIYVKGDLFLHASTNGGVKYSSYNSRYFKRKFWQVRRV